MFEVPDFEEDTIQIFSPAEVEKHLSKVNTNKSVPPAAQLSLPVCHVINSSIKLGKWSMWGRMAYGKNNLIRKLKHTQ